MDSLEYILVTNNIAGNPEFKFMLYLLGIGDSLSIAHLNKKKSDGTITLS